MQGQEPAPSPAPTKPPEERVSEPPVRPAEVVLAEGREIKLKFAQTVTARFAVKGEPVELALADDLLVGSAVVAREGARVLGTVIEGKDTEKRGKAKSLKVRLDFLRVGTARIPLRGEKAAERKAGDYKGGEVAAASILFGLTGLLGTSGKHYVIPEGTLVVAFVHEDTQLPVLEWREAAPPESTPP